MIEFEVIEQLRKMPTQVSLLELFKSSEKHKNTLLKVLNEVHVPETIVKCYGKEISRVLVDNGSSFNLCPLDTLRRLEKERMLKTSRVTLRAYDGMKNDVIGEVELEVMIGPSVFLIDFQVVDVRSSFSLLLGRPWIHMAGAVPSSLHQKVKFPVGKKMVTVFCEADFIGHLDSNEEYLSPETTEEADYRSMELVHMVHTPAGTRVRSPEFSDALIMSGKVLVENGFEPGKGLGKNAQGITKPIIPPSYFARGGIGFHGEVSDLSIRGMTRGRGRGRFENRGGRAVNPDVWMGRPKSSSSMRFR